MRRTVNKIRPAKGFSHVIHNVLNVVYVGLLLLFVRLDFEMLAFALILLSKWRVLAVKPRYWLTHIRVNLVDILVGLSVLSYMFGTLSLGVQLLWGAVYCAWLIVLKPRSDRMSVALQALLSQTITLCALFRNFTTFDVSVFIVVTWITAFAAANHFLTTFEEEDVRLLSHMWALFCATLVWVASHWMTFYGDIPQVAVIIAIFAYALSGIYSLHAHDRLTQALRRQFMLVAVALLFVILVFSDWQILRF